MPNNMLLAGSTASRNEQCYGNTAAAPVLVASGTMGEDAGLGVLPSRMGRPAALRSAFQRDQDGPPAVSNSSCKMLVDHLPCSSRFCVRPSSEVKPYEGEKNVQSESDSKTY